MKTNREQSEIFIVVQVHSGIPILAEAYTDETAAIDRAEELKTDTNPEYDEVDVFDAQLK
jgi:hypothetical protein